MSDKERREQLDDEIKRKGDADIILNSYLHKEAWNVIEMHLFDQFSKSKHEQSDEREALYREMKALQRVKKYYESILTTGKMAEKELTKLQKAVNSVKKVIQM
jgi:CRISPR/Cas system CMR-associated protein Cmr5 small subunit